MSWSRPRVIGAAVTAVLVATTLAACGSDAGKSAGGSSGTASAGFPVTLKNTFGETTITKKPERIVTLGWNAQDVVYALDETRSGCRRSRMARPRRERLPGARASSTRR